MSFLNIVSGSIYPPVFLRSKWRPSKTISKLEVASHKEEKHFVLVHGAGHGAWSWFKVKPLLEAARHRVTAVDLLASGINTRSYHELHTFHDYSKPLLDLMAAIPSGEKVILVGHSFGGINISLAMDKYPEKVSVAVYVSAFMPDTTHSPYYPLDKHLKWIPEGNIEDTQFLPYGNPEDQETAVLFGPKYISSILYQNCSAEDIELAKMLVRPISLFRQDLSKAKNFTNQGYGSVKRVYIMCKDDKSLPFEFQRELVDSIDGTEVKELKNADHSPMFSQPQELFRCLQEIANQYK